VVGATVATAVASSKNATTTSNAYAAGYNAGATNTSTANANAAAANANAAAANANAAAANANMAAANTTVTNSAAAVNYNIGETVAVLPTGCMSPEVQGKTYFLCGNTWFSPAYGANGVYYRVVSTP
jgi:hypothetical protein